MKIRVKTLDAALAAAAKDHTATHGAAGDTFGHIAAIWSARLGQTVTPAQVSIMLIDLKTARAWGNPSHADNWVDIASFAACGAELAGASPDDARPLNGGSSE